MQPDGNGYDLAGLRLAIWEPRGIREAVEDGTQALRLLEVVFGVHGRKRKPTATRVKCSDEHYGGELFANRIALSCSRAKLAGVASSQPTSSTIPHVAVGELAPKKLSEIERKVWHGLLDADLGRIYYAKLAGRFYGWDLALKIFLGCATSGTVAGWTFWNDPVRFPLGDLVWKIVSAAAALVAVIAPLLNLAKKVEWATALSHAYSKILGDYELFWAQIESAKPAQIVRFLEDVRRKEESLAPLEAHFPKQDDELNRQCQKAINHKRGLTHE